jgi:hypothetical protein
LANDAGNTGWTRDMGFPNHRGLHRLWQGGELKFSACASKPRDQVAPIATPNIVILFI